MGDHLMASGQPWKTHLHQLGIQVRWQDDHLEAMRSGAVLSERERHWVARHRLALSAVVLGEWVVGVDDRVYSHSRDIGRAELAYAEAITQIAPASEVQDHTRAVTLWSATGYCLRTAYFPLWPHSGDES